MTEPVELHVLCDSRRPVDLAAFRQGYLRGMTVDQADFPYPEHAAKPDREFTSEDDLLEFLISHASSEYSLYWSNPDGGACVHFLRDGAVLYGLAPSGEPAGGFAQALSDLAHALGARCGYVWPSMPAPETTQEFEREMSHAEVRVP